MVSPRSITVHHGFRSQEARRARKQNIDYAKQHHTPHCWLPAKVMYPANSTNRFSWLTRSTAIFIVEECSNIYIYIFNAVFEIGERAIRVRPSSSEHQKNSTSIPSISTHKRPVATGWLQAICLLKISYVKDK